jgi:hypothetical protein
MHPCQAFVMNRSPWAARAAAWLPVMTAIGYLFFFVPNLVLAVTHRISTLPPVFARLFDWGGEGGDSAAVMLSTVSIVWAIFLFRHRCRAARTPAISGFQSHRELCPPAAMLVIALTMPHEHQHAPGVLAL